MLAPPAQALFPAVLVLVALVTASYTAWRVHLWKLKQEQQLTQLSQSVMALTQLRTDLAGGKTLAPTVLKERLGKLLPADTLTLVLQAGVPLRNLLKAFETALRDHRNSLQQVWTQLAGIRATTLLLTQLPVLGIGLGYLVGAHPLRFLTSGWGSLVLAAGIGCQCLGVWWIGRMLHTITFPSSAHTTRLHVSAALLDAGLPLSCAARYLGADISPVQKNLLRNAHRDGTPIAEVLVDCAHDAQAEAVNTCQQQIEEIGVLLARPLGLCFLPGFLLLGIIPTVLELGGSFMGFT
ncbi:MAG TPA: hypothetical protein GX530_05920 [Corynebacteriales bacterium]|nr:hypothetical protein [Mycobacteriales bacterium]